MTQPISPGLIVLHGNRLELLRDAVFDWLQANPLDPLEQAVFLVQSNGVAEWLKIALAERSGICAASTIALPARFLWDAYRDMLGRDQVPRRSAFDKAALTWRLMRLLPDRLGEPDFAPLRHFLADGDPERRLQLSARLADLFDQYQVYRADWLYDWADGRDQLRPARGEPVPLGDDQRWQAQLWRAVLASMPDETRMLGRAHTHRRFLQAIDSGAAPAQRLPRRVVLFGISALPLQTLEALAALATHTQVILTVPNPCQFHWGDIMDGRELMQAERRRLRLREGRDLTAVPLEDLHAHSHPLLASWGRLGRDFVRMLDAFDDAASAQARFSLPRIDLFDDTPGDTLLSQVQAAVRDLQPLSEHPQVPPDPADRSIEFHVAHSAQREVEILHDQLLRRFATPTEPQLRPREVVVMVPDIEIFAPAIRAVFGQYSRHDPRYIPFEIGDVNDRSINPLLVALDWLLRLPDQRCRQSEVRDLLDVPAIAGRFGLDEDALPLLGQWIEGAGVRWGLDVPHRDGLGLAATGEQNDWLFGIRRMLLGYASGQGASFAGIEAYGEVGGLDAALAGSLAQFVEALVRWRAVLAQTATPAEWGQHARNLLGSFFTSVDERDRLTLAQLDTALQRWLEACEDADFVEPVPLAVLREAWLGAIDEPTLNHRFVSGGVTFCTLMPMRAVPFRVVCLLGMNDGDFPRRAPKADFDLLALPGMARPGDRSRRDDDRYLMLEAVLAAREGLYVSWVGRNQRDNSPQPPSVLVSQLRDYLAAGWSLDLAALTTEHPLQPFSRRYFEDGGLTTFAREWRQAHLASDTQEGALAPFVPEPEFRLTLAELGRFVKQPVRYFFRQRLGVVFDADSVTGEDDEPFGLDGLTLYFLADTLLDDSGEPEPPEAVPQCLRERADRLVRAGQLSVGQVGLLWREKLVADLTPVRRAWLALRAQYPLESDKLPVAFEHAGLRLEDWLDRMHGDGHQSVWLAHVASTLTDRQGVPRGDRLIDGWLRQLAAAALGHQVTGYLLGRDAIVEMPPLDPAEARAVLQDLMECWSDGMNRPLPTASRTALALLAEGNPQAAYDGGFQVAGEAQDSCLARLWPDFEALAAEPDWEETSRRLYGPLSHWLQTGLIVTRLDGADGEDAA